MRKVILTLLVVALAGTWANAQKIDTASMHPGKKWFHGAKYGLFIHWMLTNLDSEEDARTGYEGYKRTALSVAKKFTASKFDAKNWAAKGKEWGVKYAVLTTKHHNGFALYKAGKSPFNVIDHSPAKSDMVKPYAEAFRAQGIKVGFYFSLPDRMNPNYHSIVMNPKTKRADSTKSDFKKWQLFTDQMLLELRHLLTAYGKVDLLWFDGDWERNEELWRSKEIKKLVDELQPWCVINNRLKSAEVGDYGTPESNPPLFDVGPPWFEFCYTLGDNWASDKANENLKPLNELLEINASIWQKGGNVLLNVAPEYDGLIPVGQTSRMDSLAKFNTKFAEAIYGTENGIPHELWPMNSTTKPGVLYLFVNGNPARELVLKGCKSEIESITNLADGKKLNFRMSSYFKGWEGKGWIYITPPTVSKAEAQTVLKVTFKNNIAEFRGPNADIKW